MNLTPSSAQRAERLMRRATYASVSAASLLIVAKLGTWLATDAISLLSTLIDSLLDAAASVVNLLAVRQALAPADEDHRFGHGKAEALSSLAQAAFIGGSALFLLIAAGQRLAYPQIPDHSTAGLFVMALSISLTLALVIYQRYVVRETKSLAIQADSLHYQSDILINIGVMASLWMSAHFGWLLLDPLFGIAVAFYLMHTVTGIARNALDMLMDHELSLEERRRIAAIARTHPQVLGVHDMRTRASGTHAFVQLHLEMDGSLSLQAAHEVAETVMHQIMAAFPQAEVLIHQDPSGVEEERDHFAPVELSNLNGNNV